MKIDKELIQELLLIADFDIESHAKGLTENMVDGGYKNGNIVGFCEGAGMVVNQLKDALTKAGLLEDEKVDWSDLEDSGLDAKLDK